MQRNYSLIVFLCAIFSFGQSQSTSSPLSTQQEAPSALDVPSYQAEFAAAVADGQHRVSWNKGYLLSFGDGSQPITLYDKTGKWLFETPLTFDGTAKIFIQDAAPTSAGTGVVAASAANNDGAAADLIAEIGNDGVRHVVRTSPFYPFRVCATDEGTVWAYGSELNQARNADPRGHYPMLREYSFDKGQLRSEVDRMTVQPPKGVPVNGSIPYDVQMRCGAGKVVVLSMPTSELMEYDLVNSRLNRWSLASLPAGFHLTGAALTDSGEIYVSALQGGPKPRAQTAIFHLAVTSSGTASWTPITTAAAEDKWYMLMGSDGENLVYSRGLHSPTLFWSKAQKGVIK